MTCSQSDLTGLSDAALLSSVQSLAARERCATADLIAALAELDARRLYLGQGCSSLFSYCTRVLHLSEHAAYGRIEAARVARRFPIVLEMLGRGVVNLTAICLLAPHLTAENHLELLQAMRCKTKREVEEFIAAIRPKPPVQSILRKLLRPSATAASTLSTLSVPESLNARTCLSGALPTSPGRAVAAPLSPERYKIQFTVSRETYDKLRRAQDLLRHVIPNGDVGEIVSRAPTTSSFAVARTTSTRWTNTSGWRPRREDRRAPARAADAYISRERWAGASAVRSSRSS